MVFRRALEPPTRERRERYELMRSPSAVSSAGPGLPLVRQALLVLRPALSTIWVDAEAQDDWPEEVLPAVTALTALLQEQQGLVGIVLRPLTGTTEVLLDPADDAQFDLAVTLAPFSRVVRAISVEGAQVYARDRDRRLVHLWLTEAEHARLADPALPGQLVKSSHSGGLEVITRWRQRLRQSRQTDGSAEPP